MDGQTTSKYSDLKLLPYALPSDTGHMIVEGIYCSSLYNFKILLIHSVLWISSMFLSVLHEGQILSDCNEGSNNVSVGRWYRWGDRSTSEGTSTTGDRVRNKRNTVGSAKKDNIFIYHRLLPEANLPIFFVEKPLSLLGICYLEKVMAPHSSTLAWKIPWMEEPSRLQPMGLWRVGHDWATLLSLFTFMHWRRKWQPTPVFLPGESQGQESLVSCHLWGRTESDTTDAT